MKNVNLGTCVTGQMVVSETGKSEKSKLVERETLSDEILRLKYL